MNFVILAATAVSFLALIASFVALSLGSSSTKAVQAQAQAIESAERAEATIQHALAVLQSAEQAANNKPAPHAHGVRPTRSVFVTFPDAAPLDVRIVKAFVMLNKADLNTRDRLPPWADTSHPSIAISGPWWKAAMTRAPFGNDDDWSDTKPVARIA